MEFRYDFSDYKKSDFDPKAQAERVLISVHADSDVNEDKEVARKRLGYALKEVERQITDLIVHEETTLTKNVSSSLNAQSYLQDIEGKLEQLMLVYERIRSLVVIPSENLGPLHEAIVNLHSTYMTLYWLGEFFGIQAKLFPFFQGSINENEKLSRYYQASLLLQESDQLLSRFPLMKRQSSVSLLLKLNITNRSRIIKETSSYLLSQEDQLSFSVNSNGFTNACSVLYMLDKYLLEQDLTRLLSSRIQKAIIQFDSIFQLSPTTRRLLHNSTDPSAANSTIWSKFEDGWYQISKIGAQCVFWERSLQKANICNPDYPNLLEYFQMQPNFILDGATICIYFFKELAISISSKMQMLDRRDPILLRVFRSDFQRVTHIVEQAIARSSSEIVNKDTRECSIVMNSLRVLAPKNP
ncbi:hypothetical protein POMI540_0552 [Schizosaccharomyces pombe]